MSSAVVISKLKKLVVGGVGIAGLALSLSASAQVNIKLGHVLQATHSWNTAAQGFAEQVGKETAGRVNISVFPASQLGSEKDMVEGLQFGSLQGGVIGASSFGPVEPKIKVTELPYAWPTISHAHRAYDGELGSALSKLLDDKGFVVLGWLDLGTRHVTNRRGPVVVPTDLPGLKLRTPPDQMRIETFKQYGAQPAPLAFGELYSALQQGVFDGQENPVEIIFTSSFFEVQKYLSLTGHVSNAGLLVISKLTWNKISDGDKAIMRNAAKRVQDIQRKAQMDGEMELIAKLKQKGMLVNEINREAFVKASQPIWEKNSPGIGPDLMKLLDKYRKS
jgi:tripartite ATP-independent transporter DctP family solute receptor